MENKKQSSDQLATLDFDFSKSIVSKVSTNDVLNRNLNKVEPFVNKIDRIFPANICLEGHD